MKDLINTREEKIKAMLKIKLDFLKGEITLQEAKDLANDKFDSITGQEFALSEQNLTNHGISDQVITDRLDELIEIFEDIRISDKINPPEGHPINTYIKEVEAIKKLIYKMEEALEGKFIKNVWEEIYEQLEEVKIHFARKQNQLYPALEKKKFNKPTKIMWTLEDRISGIINKNKLLLKEDKHAKFIRKQEKLISSLEDMMAKEIEVLYPTAMNLISDEEFIDMRKGDDEIGYCLIDTPAIYKNAGNKHLDNQTDFMKDLSSLLSKHGIIDDLSSQSTLEVSRGQLTLDQINLIFKHLKVDLSYVDENEIVRFYTDTKDRIFPRSPGVIGRKVENCHPKESLDKVLEVIEEFKSGAQDEAEFWLDTGEKFIYINFIAVRDDEGNFKGVLEMMQDITRIKELEGNQLLANWTKH
ncbi:MAG: DUF438 domain-containing protein [Epulopiscium sp.]|nr:DUF438 domain-containing protein [Candidatus Epulonipiscium sp.]